MRTTPQIIISMIVTCSFFFISSSCVNCLASQLDEEESVMVKTNEALLSKVEEDWYHKFQNGIMFFDGWKKISHDLITSFPDGDQIKLKENLNLLGRKIGIEWCKDNAIRKINTEKLHKWGEMLIKAVEHGQKNISDTINRVEKEVDEILLEKVASSQ